MQPSNILDIVGASRPEPEREPSRALGRDEFLRMLIAQLENQDPLNPQEATEFSAQLAQFSTLEQLLSIREAIETMANPTTTGRVLSATGLIGRDVLIEGNRFTLDAAGSTQALEFELPSRSSATEISISDDTGLVLRTLELGPLDAGRHTFDPRSADLGGGLPEGIYQFQVKARLGPEELEARRFVRGRVTGAAAPEDGASTPQVLLGELRVPADALLEIRAPEDRP